MTLRAMLCGVVVVVIGYSAAPLFLSAAAPINGCCASDGSCPTDFVCVVIPGDDCSGNEVRHCVPVPAE
jgi:hypothetical protein